MGFSKHCIEHNHFFSEKNVKLLFHTEKVKQMDVLEVLAIKKDFMTSANIANTQTNFTTVNFYI